MLQVHEPFGVFLFQCPSACFAFRQCVRRSFRVRPSFGVTTAVFLRHLGSVYEPPGVVPPVEGVSPFSYLGVNEEIRTLAGMA